MRDTDWPAIGWRDLTREEVKTMLDDLRWAVIARAESAVVVCEATEPRRQA